MTHEQYLDEPAHVIDWALQFAELDAQIAEEQIKAARDGR